MIFLFSYFSLCFHLFPHKNFLFQSKIAGFSWCAELSFKSEYHELWQNIFTVSLLYAQAKSCAKTWTRERDGMRFVCALPEKNISERSVVLSCYHKPKNLFELFCAACNSSCCAAKKRRWQGKGSRKTIAYKPPSPSRWWRSKWPGKLRNLNKFSNKRWREINKNTIWAVAWER